MLTPCTPNSQYNDLISKAQIVSVCVCVRVWRPRLFLSVRNRNRHAHSARTREGLRKNMHKVPSQGIDPSIKFLDDANTTHSSSFQHTPTPVLCRLYATSSFPKLQAIEYLLPTKLTLLALSFLSKFRLHLHQIQPTRFLQQALNGEYVDFYRNKREEQNSNSFSTSGTSQQTLHVTCLRTYHCTAVSCPYEGRAMDPRYKYYHSHSHPHVLHWLLCCYHIHSLTEYEQLWSDCG